MNNSLCIARLCPLVGFLTVALCGLAQTHPEADQPASIAAFVAETLANNPELAFYEAEIQAARAGQRSAGMREVPELSLELSRKRVTESGGTLAGEGTAWSVSVSQTFEWPGRLALRKAIANQDIALAELGLARFKAALANRARTLAYGLHAAHKRSAAFAEVAQRYRALRELFLARDPGGIAPLLETRVIEAQELTLQRRATEAQLAVQAALVELNQLRGQPATTPISVGEAELAFGAAPDLETVLATARENNFEFRSAKIELEQQGLIVSLARHEGRPSFTVSPYYSHEEAGDKERTYGLGLSVPLPTGDRIGASVAMAEARRRQAETAVLVAQRTMEREVITASQRFAAKLAEVAKWSPDAAGKFRDAAELADRHFRLGAVPISTYVELQNSYLEAIDALFETQLEALEARGALELATGLEVNAQETTP